MIKCLLIYLWIYIGLFYMIEAGEDDEHVHIKLHMTSGQRKRAQIQQHTHQHHKKRHTTGPHRPHRHTQQHHSHHPPTSVATTTTNLYHESPHNYLTGITTASTSSLMPQNHVFQTTHTKKHPSLSSPLNLHESGQLLNMDEDVYAQGDVGDDAVFSVDTDASEPLTIESYLTKNFASFPQPTTTYETEIIPHKSEGFNVASAGLDGLEDIEEDNEITASLQKAKGNIQSMLLGEQMENYQRHKPSSLYSATRTIKNEQLLQQLLQQQHNNEQPEIINAAAYKSALLQSNKNKAEKDYYSEDDMTEAIMYSSSPKGTKHNAAQPDIRPNENVDNSGRFKPITVDDIWSQLQQQYLNKYTPQAQPLLDSEEQPAATMPTKTKPKRKRNTKRQKYAKPTTITSYSTAWPAKSSSKSVNNQFNSHYLQPINQQQQQQYYNDIHSPPSASAFSSTSVSTNQDTDIFVKRPFYKINSHSDEDDTADGDDAAAAEFEQGEENDDFDTYGDESYEDAVYQRGKKFAGHTVYGQHNHHMHKPFGNHDLYGSFSTPITATVATNVQPSTYHPNLVSSTLPSFTSATHNSFLPTISHPSTSYQWHTQQNYPASYQTYHLQHQKQQQQQQPQWTAEDQYAQQQSSALRLPEGIIIQTPNTITGSKLSPTQSNDFTVSSSSSSIYTSSPKSTVQPPSRYKKRKNRTKPKRNRIVVI